MNTNKQLSRLGAMALLLPLTLGAILPARAAIIRPDGASIAEGLTAHGHTELKVKPDIARLSIGVTTQAAKQADAAQDNARRTTALLAALRSAGIADRDIQTSDYIAQPQYDYKNSPPVLTGYQVTNSVQVTVRDLKKAGTVVDTATQAGATDVSGLTFDLADRAAAERQALAQAVTNAQGKADAMAQAAGVSRGRLLDLSEGSPVSVQPILYSARAMADAAPAQTTPIQSNEITLTADVTAIYAIGPQ